MWKKIIVVAVPTALLACALAAAEPAPQFSSNVSIRFVEVIEIDELPIPLSGGENAADMDGPPADEAEKNRRPGVTIRKGKALRRLEEIF